MHDHVMCYYIRANNREFQKEIVYPESAYNKISPFIYLNIIHMNSILHQRCWHRVPQDYAMMQVDDIYIYIYVHTYIIIHLDATTDVPSM